MLSKLYRETFPLDRCEVRSRLATALIWIGLVILFLVAYERFGREAGTRRASAPIGTEESLESLRRRIEQDQVSYLEVAPGKVRAYLDEHPFVVTADGSLEDAELARMREKGIDPVSLPELRDLGAAPADVGSSYSLFSALLPILLPIVLIIAYLVWASKRAQQGGWNLVYFRKAKLRELAEGRRIGFQQVGGCDDAKTLLRDVVDYLKDPDRWEKAKVLPPRGILLEGPPGCGKTLLARAVAGESGAKFFVNSATEFVELFVGVGAARVRDLFEEAAKQAPSVIFIDELDAIGRRRGAGTGWGHDEREQTLNQLLVHLDGIERTSRVVVIAATNRADVLDRALLRPGRFDRRIVVPPLREEDRRAVLEIHTRNKLLAKDVSIGDLAEKTDGFTGADLETLVNEAALLALRRCDGDPRGDLTVTSEDFARALPALVERNRDLNAVDVLIIESATQLSRPAGRAHARLHLVSGALVEGDLLWADGSFVSIRDADGDVAIHAKRQILRIEPLEGSGRVRPDDVMLDRWNGKQPGAS